MKEFKLKDEVIFMGLMMTFIKLGIESDSFEGESWTIIANMFDREWIIE